jgi:hypothetical protein
MRKTTRIIFILILTGLMGARVLLSSAHALEESREYEVKAAFIYHFAKFVSWPGESKSDPLIIGVLGNDPFGKIWEEIRRKTVRGRPIVVNLCGNDLGLAKKCQVVFISRVDREKLKIILGQLFEKPVLTIADLPLFAETGGMIGFYSHENKVRFAINLESCKKAGLAVSSNLLKLARIVE